MVQREALLRNTGQVVVQHHNPALLRAQRLDVFVMQGAGHHDQAITASLHQELDAVLGLLAFIAQAHAEGHHHVQACGAQLGVDDLQDRRVKGAAQDRYIDADHLAGAGQQRARRMRRAKSQFVDRLLHLFKRGWRHRTFAADYAGGGAQTYARQAGYVFDSGHWNPFLLITSSRAYLKRPPNQSACHCPGRTTKRVVHQSRMRPVSSGASARLPLQDAGQLLARRNPATPRGGTPIGSTSVTPAHAASRRQPAKYAQGAHPTRLCVHSPPAAGSPHRTAAGRRLQTCRRHRFRPQSGFMAGAPRKPATNRLAGRSYTSLGRADLLDLPRPHHDNAAGQCHRLDPGRE